ncbi:MAG TPA: transglutaminase-like cysteine peptidase [Parvibaculum sp.]
MKRIFLLAMAAGTAIWLSGCQATGSVSSLQGEPDTGTIVKTGAYMPVGQQVNPPYGYVAFCVKSPKECEGGTDTPTNMALTQARWVELNQVNDYVNTNIPQIEDIANYGVNELWTYPNQNGGDCEDLALLKRKMLIERGWSPSDVLVTVVREWNGDGHAILVVDTDKGEYVLDNKNWAIVAWADAPYTWVKRQSRERPYIWVNLDQRSFRYATNDKLPPLGAPIPFLAALNPAPAPAQVATEQPSKRDGLRPGITADLPQTPTATLAMR